MILKRLIKKKCFQIISRRRRRLIDFFADTINPIKVHDKARRTGQRTSSRTAQWGWENGNNGRLLYCINNGRFLTVSQSAITPHFWTTMEHKSSALSPISTLRQKRSSFSRALAHSSRDPMTSVYGQEIADGLVNDLFG